MKELSMNVALNIIREIFGDGPVDFSTEKLEKGIYYLDPKMVWPDNPELWEETTVLPASGAHGVLTGVAPYQTVWEEDGAHAYTGEVWHFPDVLICLCVVDIHYMKRRYEEWYKILSLEKQEDGGFTVYVQWDEEPDFFDINHIYPDDFKVAKEGEEWPDFSWPRETLNVAEAEEEGGEQ